MHGVDGAQQKRDHRYRNGPTIDAQDERDAAYGLPHDGQVGERRWQAEAGKVLSRSGRRENENPRARWKPPALVVEARRGEGGSSA